VDGIMQEARKDAERILADARQAETALQRDTAAGQRQFSGYLAGFRALLERQLSEIEALEARHRDNHFPESS
jgi:cell division septum initiation protein DivIVA